ncbi:MAG: hypothetical protein HY317_01125 [Acidobacteria bacterium]|nr:hypothetical protein [Acidobacteriota bacterium]
MRTGVRAVVLSFAVYAAPLVTVHSVTLTGVYLAASWRRGETGPTRVALEWAAVLLAQAGLFAALWLARRSRAWLQAVAGLATWAGAVVFLNAALLLAIPMSVLIEPDAAAERGGLTEDCAVPAASLHAWETPPAMSEAGEALLYPAAGETLRLLRMPGCQVIETAIPTSVTYLSVQAGGLALFATQRPAETRPAWFRAREGRAEPVALEGWQPRSGTPRLLLDGRTAAWIERRTTPEGSAPREPPVAAVRIVDLETGRTRAIPIVGLAGGFLLVDGTGPGGPFVVERQAEGREFVILGGDGHPVGPPLVPEPGTLLSEALDRFVLLDRRWVGWSGYEEERRYAVAWDLRAGAGRHEVPRGRLITSVAVDPAGAWVAVSASTALNIGAIRDSVVLLRASDGAEVFRRYFPTYHRSAVALLGRSRWFALTDATADTPTVRAYALPPAT